MGPYADAPIISLVPPCVVEPQMLEIAIDYSKTGIHLYGESFEEPEDFADDSSPVGTQQSNQLHPSRGAGHLSLVV